MKNSLKETMAYSFSLFIVAAISTILFFIVTETLRIVICRTKGNGGYSLHPMLLFPVATIFVLYFTLYNDRWIPHTGLYSILCALLCILLLIVNVVHFYTYHQQQKTYELKMAFFAAQRHQEEQELIAEQQKKYLNDLAALSHDFKNHLLTIQTMLEEKDSQACSYIENLTGTVLKRYQHNYSFTNNVALNGILSYRKVECEESGIKFNLSIDYPNFDFINYTDVCAIFGNAFDNAITACKMVSTPKPYINFATSAQNKMISISIINSINLNQQLIPDDNEGFISTKNNHDAHGFGLVNIKNAVQRYNGVVVFDATQTEFRVTIIIPIPE